MAFVQMYKSTDLNAPVLTGQVGSLITLMDACLVNGYTPASVTSITRSGTTATVTIGSANTTMATGDRFTIAGAAQSDYNGTFQITLVDSTHFTITVANSPTTPATGTITYAKAGLGWAKPFSGTNLAAYRSANVTSNRFYLRVDDTGLVDAAHAGWRGYESMTDVNSGVNQFPTFAQSHATLAAVLRKSATADATARAWTLVGDDKTFYVIPAAGQNATYDFKGGCFGHIISAKPGDGYNTYISGSTATGAANGGPGWTSGNSWFSSDYRSNPAGWLARSYGQLGSSTLAPLTAVISSNTGNGPNYGPWSTTTLGGAVNFFPNLPDGGLYFSSIIVGEPALQGITVMLVRGRMPGMFACNNVPTFAQYAQYAGIVNLGAGAVLTSCQIGSNQSQGTVFFDTVGPWL